ncbi:hypothetical protein [Leuconostoc pseudomesenteroides]|uniref:hypothetical protein n=1 Tax=Leuconostoc pseudomesenteroides TaxID=33968 RepID=UPI0021A85B54|nr:hypothetical protein [Leuconostoc pseudomesenteroides]MCT4413734.1 hypothetical protein [Leuconostoc pseudomesenteroides]
MTRGSEWGKWDLHVHSYNTKMNNQYQIVTLDEYLQALEDSDIKVFGITDYFNIETQLETIEKFQIKFPDSEKRFFVNIEFRLDKNVSTENAGHVNVHLLFDPTEERLKDFADSLCITETNDNGTHRKMSSLSENEFDGATVTLDEIEKKLGEIFGKDKPYFWVMAAGGHGGIRPNGAMRNNILADELDKRADFLFGSVANTDYYLDVAGQHRYPNSMSKAVISASDAHRLERENEETGIGDGFTWIKAEPTLEGLRQIIFEPESRVKIQDTVPDYKEPYYVIDHVEFTQNGNLKQVYFNPNLNAIIGGRSNGKSTLTNTIAKALNNDVFVQKTNDGVKMFTLNQNGQTNDFKIIWSGESEANHDREIMFFPQDYMIQIAENTDELNNIVSRVVRSDKNMFGKLQRYNDQVRQTTDSIQLNLQELARVYNDLENAKQVKPEGDLAGIKANLETINLKISEIKRSSDFNEEIQSKYEAKNMDLRGNVNRKRLAELNLDEIASRANDKITIDTKPIISDDHLFNKQLNNLISSVEQTARTVWQDGLETMRQEQEKNLSEFAQNIADINGSPEYIAGKNLLQANQELKELDDRKN